MKNMWMEKKQAKGNFYYQKLQCAMQRNMAKMPKGARRRVTVNCTFKSQHNTARRTPHNKVKGPRVQLLFSVSDEVAIRRQINTLLTLTTGGNPT